MTIASKTFKGYPWSRSGLFVSAPGARIGIFGLLLLTFAYVFLLIAAAAKRLIPNDIT
jgi:hypothetical protein